jgi:hypothetical protein
MDFHERNVHNITAGCEEKNKIGVAMKFGILITAVIGAALPLEAGVVFTMDPTVATPTNAGTYAGGATLFISATGTVNLNGPSGLIVTNPDGSMSNIPSAACIACWAPGYEFFIPGADSYPTAFGGDGINHFTGGGGNFDLFPGDHSAWATQGKQTTDTMDVGALRFGALAYTFQTNPTATDWFLLGYGGTFVTPQGGGTLLMVVVDTFYTNNTGSYTVTVDQQAVPEPGAIWLAFSGVALFGLPRAFRRLSRKG